MAYAEMQDKIVLFIIFLLIKRLMDEANNEK